jgi:hypothetical protein
VVFKKIANFLPKIGENGQKKAASIFVERSSTIERACQSPNKKLSNI